VSARRSILNTRLVGTPCAWCYLSAVLSATLVVTLGSSMGGRQLRVRGARAAAAHTLPHSQQAGGG
jgi:hypothetical protein